MKRFVLVSAMALMVSAAASAQGIFSENMFNHYSVGLTAGTPGWGLDAATTVGDLFQVRVGFTTIPNIKATADLDVSAYDQIPASYRPSNSTIKGEGKLNMTNFKLLIDIFPFKSSSFHFTTGFYAGPSKFVQVYNKEDGALRQITAYNATQTEANQVGIELGDYLLKPDAKGNVGGDIKVNGFKPYLGIGFGRAVPRTNRVGFMFELGCQFWGSPKVYTGDHQLTSQDLNGDDGGVLKVMSKIVVYPVLNFRLCGRIL